MREAVDYQHGSNCHTVQGADAALSKLFEDGHPESLLDVGCGTGTWLRAALDNGVRDVSGIDGIPVPPDSLHVPPDRIVIRDLRDEWAFGRRFDLVLCLEVAEHLPADAAASLVQKLTGCSDRIYFSAANPWQGGQHHVNAQWPAYWQALFNANGFVCLDSLRWKLWQDDRIEPWYRQNIFLAEKNEAAAGKEMRIPAVVHPDCMRSIVAYWRYSQQSLLEAMAHWVYHTLRRMFGAEQDELM